MKTSTILAVLAALSAATTTVLAQGSLTPPGAPAPTMKTLDQVEARTPIETLPYTISAPGSYYFTKKLEFSAATGNAISITTNNVTLDLNGFTLSSTADVTGTAIICGTNLTNIEIKNGIIAGNTTVTISSGPPSVWMTAPAGFSYGVHAYSSAARNFLVSHLQVSGCRNVGIFAYYGSVTSSTATSNGNYGISSSYGSVTNSTATSNGGTGIDAFYGSVTDSTATSNGGTGISAAYGSVTSSTATSNGTFGIDADYGSVTSSTATSNGSTGISADSGNVTSSTATSNAGTGIGASYGSVTDSTATSNGNSGIVANSGSVTNSTAKSNSGEGIYADSGSVTNSTATSNVSVGIYADFGSVTRSTAKSNGNTGIRADSGSVTDSTATSNVTYGIVAIDGSVTSCVARSNNTSTTAGVVDLYALSAVIAFTKYGTGTTTGSTLTGNQTP